MPALRNGAVAGLAGTAAMTATQAVEMRLSGRPPSRVPGQVAAKLLRLLPAGDTELARISTGMHWAHGMTQGLGRSAVGALGLTGTTATATHFAMMWTGDVALYKALGIADWPWRWSLDELAPDLLHKGVHAVVTGAAYDRLN